VALTILYDAFRHHATDFTSIKDADKFVTKNWKHNFDEAQEDSEECFNRAEAFDQHQTVAKYHTSQARTQARQPAAIGARIAPEPPSRFSRDL
jgi:hypothetical protein